MRRNMAGNWVLDEFGAWNLHMRSAHVWIVKRPVYCDRGHYQANVDGIVGLDGADGFPRYYMSLEVAMAEMEAWLAWRFECERLRGMS
jgi:hypothetical protein